MITGPTNLKPRFFSAVEIGSSKSASRCPDASGALARITHHSVNVHGKKGATMKARKNPTQASAQRTAESKKVFDETIAKLRAECAEIEMTMRAMKAKEVGQWLH
jgi:hypothetical protein